MKKLIVVGLCALLAGLCACGQSETSKWKIKTNKKDPYSYVIKEYYDLNAYARYYALYDIDGNGTQELLMGVDHWGYIGLVAVYIIQNDVAIEQELWWMDEQPPNLLFKNGTVRGEGSGNEGILSYGYYRFEAGELKWQISLNINNGEYFKRYPSDPMKFIPIDEEEYECLKLEFEGDGQIVELDWKPLAEYGR